MPPLSNAFQLRRRCCPLARLVLVRDIPTVRLPAAGVSRAPVTAPSRSLCFSRSARTLRRNVIIRLRWVRGVALHFPVAARLCATLNLRPVRDVV